MNLPSPSISLSPVLRRLSLGSAQECQDERNQKATLHNPYSPRVFAASQPFRIFFSRPTPDGKERKEEEGEKNTV